MLVLTRKSEESVMVGGAIEVKVLAIKGDQVSLGFTAPREVRIHRKEVYEAIRSENRSAARRKKSEPHRAIAALGRQFRMLDPPTGAPAGKRARPEIGDAAVDRDARQREEETDQGG